VKDGNNYLGFLFNPKPADLKAGDTVTFMDIQRGSAPGLMRDGC
jgi:plastocyanin